MCCNFSNPEERSSNEYGHVAYFIIIIHFLFFVWYVCSDSAKNRGGLKTWLAVFVGFFFWLKRKESKQYFRHIEHSLAAANFLISYLSAFFTQCFLNVRLVLEV